MGFQPVANQESRKRIPMNNPHISKTAFVLVFVGLCLSGRCHAVTASAADADNDSGLSGRQILKMGFDKFMNFYVAHHLHGKPDFAACYIYRSYKEPDNKRRLALLTTQHQKQIKQLCHTLQDWENTALQLRCYESMGGTASIYISVSSSAETEQFLGQVIDCYEKPQQYKVEYVAHSHHTMRGGYLLLSRCKLALAKGYIMEAKEFRHDLPLLRRQTATLAKALSLQPSTVQRIAAKYLMDCAEQISPV